MSKEDKKEKLNYYQWEKKGQYNSDKSHAAWKFAEKQAKIELLEIVLENINDIKEETEELIEKIKRGNQDG